MQYSERKNVFREWPKLDALNCSSAAFAYGVTGFSRSWFSGKYFI